jgi:hypothetical protein
MIDEFKSFKKILRQWGHDVYIQRILPNGNHVDTFEKVTTRQVGQSGVTNAFANSEESDGLLTRYDAVYYFESSIYPKEGDRIYEDYSIKTQRNFTMFRIDAASAIRGRNGKIVYWVVGASREK